MTEENRRTGAEPGERGLLEPLQLSIAPAPRMENSLQPQKRIGAVESGEPRKRGGQPGNRNAVKTGWNTAEAKRLRLMVWQLRRRTKVILSAIEADLATRTK